MQNLLRIIYVSQVNPEHFDSQSITNILMTARENNPKHDITGMLLFDYEHFLQVIEGPADRVNELYQQIADDSRHNHVRILSKQTQEKRLFSKWAMGFSQTTTKINEVIDLDNPEPDLALSLLQEKCGDKV